MQVTIFLQFREDCERSIRILQQAALALPSQEDFIAQQQQMSIAPAEPAAETPRRKRRTKAEMAAARAGQDALEGEDLTRVAAETVEGFPDPLDPNNVAAADLRADMTRDEMLAEVRALAKKHGHVWLRTHLDAHKAASLSVLSDDALSTIITAELLS